MNATKRRHLTKEERESIAWIVSECGLAEVLRVIGTLTSNTHDDLHEAVEMRSQLCAIAKRLDH